MRGILLSILASAVIVNSAYANEDDAKAARIMWTAFECSQYAGMSGDTAKAEKLFQVGYDAGQRFLDAVRAGSISKEEWSTIVPIGVSLLLGGPTNDFMIGRVYDNATGDAYDNVVKEDARGLPLPNEAWVMDDELRVSIAKTKLLQANCGIL